MPRMIHAALSVVLFVTCGFGHQNATNTASVPADSATKPAPAEIPSAAPQTTWKPPLVEIHGKLSAADLKALPDSAFAFARARKEPLTDAAHVRSALARFRQVKNVSDEERQLAFANIRKAANYFGVRLRVTDWHELGSTARR